MHTLTAIIGLLFIATTGAIAADLTFFSVSDLHYGQSSESKDANRKGMPGILNTLAGKPYPAAVGGVIGTPTGIIIPGDLANTPTMGEWTNYAADYGLTGEGSVKLPVYDGTGNHDMWNTIVPTEMRKRNLKRKVTNIDSTNFHYSWDWGQVHFVNLNEYGSALKPNQRNSGGLTFLKADLEKHVKSSGRPVIVMQHYPFDNSAVPASDKTLLVDVLKPYNCIALVNGHSHSERFYKFNNLDAFDDGSVMNGDILVFRITPEKMSVWHRVNNDWGTLKFEKPISLGTPVAVKPGSGPTAPSFTFAVEGVGQIHEGAEKIETISIWDFSGKRVRELSASSGEFLWNRRDEGGNLVPGGVYLCRAQGKGVSARFKSIIR